MKNNEKGMTIREIATYFGLDYGIAYRALSKVKSYGRYRERFELEFAREKLIELFKEREARALKEAEEWARIIHKIETTGEA